MRRSLIALAVTALVACGKVPSVPVPDAAIWFITSPVLRDDTLRTDLKGGLVRLDTGTIRPVLAIRGTAQPVVAVATFTTYQGGRYHPEMMRAVISDSAVVQPFARAVVTASMTAGKGLLIDAQEMSASDFGTFFPFLRALASAARDRGRTPFGVIVPAGDTLAYPTTQIASAADVIVVRFGMEHRPGTPAGPPATQDFVRRELGIRSNGLGASRLAAEFPLYGYLWKADGTARTVTYRDASTMLLQEAGAFRRDEASRYLTATLRDGSTMWVPDAETIRSLIVVAQSRGVNTIALSGITGADPSLLPRTVLTR
jgi:spore germination protein YaaH